MYYGTGYGVDTMYIIVIVVSLLLGLITQNYIKRTYAKWSKVDASFRGTGADVARRMLDEGGASSVGITRVAGTLTDYYDPRDNDLHLSDENYARGSVASVATRQTGVLRLSEGDSVQLPGGRVMRVLALSQESYPDGRPREWTTGVGVERDGVTEVASFPIRVNQAGMVPIIFAISLVTFPSIVGKI